MENTKLELVVGAFVLVGILCLGYLAGVLWLALRSLRKPTVG